MIIHQIHSIGDIIFLEPMFRHFFKKNNEKPLVPVRNHLMWLSDYIESAQFITESSYTKMNKAGEKINTMYANQLYRGLPMDYHEDFENCMLDKYRLAKLPTEMWLDIDLKFNPCRGENLMTEFLTYHYGEYILKNEYSQAGNINIEIDQDELPVYSMKSVDGFTLIDWYMLIFQAKEFHTVSTSTFYLLQAMKNKFPNMATKIFIYPRPNRDGLRGITNLHPTFEFETR